MTSNAAWNRFLTKYNNVAALTPHSRLIPKGPRRSASSRELGSAFRKGSGIKSENEWEECLKRLRRLVLIEGVPEDENVLTSLGAPARPLVWKLLLDVRTLDPAMYLSLVAKGPSPMHEKIRNDAFRTLATDHEFKARVNEGALIRILDAFAWRYHDDNKTKGERRFSYVQGMNVLLAPFLYVMPSELEAFHCFCNLIENNCPTYVQSSLSGVHRGLKLLDQCLQIADPALFNHLRVKGLDAELYAFPSVLTLCAGTPPLQQLLPLWDYLLSFGTHLSILCIIAQLLLIRDELMASSHPMKLLRQFPDLNAKSIIGIATTLVRDLDDRLYDEIVQHMIAF